jgi:simple sugar transport system substrate-binding protein
MNKKIFTITNLLIVVLLVATACTTTATTQPTQQATTVPQATAPQATQAPSAQAGLPDATGKRIAVIWGSLGNDFNVKVHDSAVATLKAMGANIVVDTNAGGDRTVQVSMIENAITLKVDGMIMCDVATEIIDPVIKNAVDAGIPVVTVGAFSAEATNDVRTNEWENGWDSSLLLTKYLAGKPGNVVVAFEPGFRPIEVRFASLSAAMPFLVTDYKVVATVKAAWPNTIPEAKAQMEALLKQFPNEGDINAVFGTYDLESLGMAQAIEEAGRNIPVVGVDCSPDVLKDMNTPGSAIKGCVASDPTGMGKQGTINLINNLLGQKLPKVTWFQVVSVDLDNIASYKP